MQKTVSQYLLPVFRNPWQKLYQLKTDLSYRVTWRKNQGCHCYFWVKLTREKYQNMITGNIFEIDSRREFTLILYKNRNLTIFSLLMNTSVSILLNMNLFLNKKSSKPFLETAWVWQERNLIRNKKENLEKIILIQNNFFLSLQIPKLQNCTKSSCELVEHFGHHIRNQDKILR